jgi:transcriptional regulator with XRE-family HTH domain
MNPVTRYPRKMPKRTDALTDAILKRVQELLVQHGAPDRPMKQKTLARRSGQTYARVHKFLSGQMPYPPLDFLDALLQSFGVSLADVLKGNGDGPKQLPILRGDVQALCDLLDDAPVEVVEEVHRLAAMFLRAQAGGESSGSRTPASRAGRRAGVSGSTAARGTRRR